jgi:hypothetical protein
MCEQFWRGTGGAQNGYEVSERGRIPASVVQAFNDAH